MSSDIHASTEKKRGFEKLLHKNRQIEKMISSMECLLEDMDAYLDGGKIIVKGSIFHGEIRDMLDLINKKFEEYEG